MTSEELQQLQSQYPFNLKGLKLRNIYDGYTKQFSGIVLEDEDGILYGGKVVDQLWKRLKLLD